MDFHEYFPGNLTKTFKKIRNPFFMENNMSTSLKKEKKRIYSAALYTNSWEHFKKNESGDFICWCDQNSYSCLIVTAKAV